MFCALSHLNEVYLTESWNEIRSTGTQLNNWAHPTGPFVRGSLLSKGLRAASINPRIHSIINVNTTSLQKDFIKASSSELSFTLPRCSTTNPANRYNNGFLFLMYFCLYRRTTHCVCIRVSQSLFVIYRALKTPPSDPKLLVIMGKSPSFLKVGEHGMYMRN